MKSIWRILFFFFLTKISAVGQTMDTTYLKVHFLYGSTPRKAYKETEPKWFGGIMGGHVGIEGDSNRIVNFLPKGDFHVVAKRQRHSTYAVHSVEDFYAILGGNGDSVKKTIVYIPISLQQKQCFDSIAYVYLQQIPYDYALIGMRCAAATYDILGQLAIVPEYRQGKTAVNVFYPQILRKRLLEQAAQQHWTIVRQDGSCRRKWEQD